MGNWPMPETPARWFYMVLCLDEMVADSPGRGRGKAMTGLRRQIAMGHDPFVVNGAELVKRMWRSARFNVRFVSQIECPPSGDVVAESGTIRELIDALCFKKGYATRDEAWLSLGISPNTGSGWCNPNKDGIKRWPAFLALRNAVLGD